MDFSWNPLAMLCTPVSEGCDHCWHRGMAHRLSGVAAICEEARKAYAGGQPYLFEERLSKPLKLRRPSIIGVQFMGDLFHEDVPFEFIDKIFAVMALCPQHTFIVLTKRAERMLRYSILGSGTWEEIISSCVKIMEQRKIPKLPMEKIPTNPLRNVILGVSVSNQKDADKWIPILLQIPAAVRFVSIEPMLGPVSLADYECCCQRCKGCGEQFAGEPDYSCCVCGGSGMGSHLDWAIVGGESGPGARPMRPEWVQSIRDQCTAVGVPFFFKQWGEWMECNYYTNSGIQQYDNDGYMIVPKCKKIVLEIHSGCTTGMWRIGKKEAGRLLDGKVWDQYPDAKQKGKE